MAFFFKGKSAMAERKSIFMRCFPPKNFAYSIINRIFAKK